MSLLVNLEIVLKVEEDAMVFQIVEIEVMK